MVVVVGAFAFAFAFGWVDGGVGSVWFKLFIGISFVCPFPVTEAVVLVLALALALAVAVAVVVGVASGVTYCEINWSVVSALVRSTKGRSVVCSCETRRVFEMEVPGLSVTDKRRGSLLLTVLDASLVGTRLAGLVFCYAALFGRHLDTSTLCSHLK